VSRYRRGPIRLEPTAGLTTVTGFFEFNSVVLHIGDELVTFSGLSQQAPWRFTGVKRGALGTKAAAYDAIARLGNQVLGGAAFAAVAKTNGEIRNPEPKHAVAAG